MILPERRVDSLLAGWLFVSFLLLYFSCSKGVLEYGDDWSMVQVTHAIVDHFGVDVPPDTPGSLIGKDGRSYSKYGLGQSVIGIIPYIVGSRWSATKSNPVVVDHHVLQATGLTYAVTSVGIFATSTCIALMFLTVRALGFSPGSAVLTALALGAGTFAWHYGRTFMTEPTSMLLLLTSFYGLVRRADGGGLGWLVLSGAAAGATVVLRVGTLVVLPALGLLLILGLWPQRRDLLVVIKALACWLIPIGAMLTVVAVYNYVRFATFAQTGYGDPDQNLAHPMLIGLAGFLFSPGKSVFVYAPILLASLWGWAALSRRNRSVALAVTVLVMMYVAFHAKLIYWWGGGAWGPRYLAMLLPLCLLGLPALLETPLGLRAKAVLISLACVSLVVQFTSIYVPYIPYEIRIKQNPSLLQPMLWSPKYSPLWYELKCLFYPEYPPDFAYTYFHRPQWMPYQRGGFILAVALLSSGLLFAFRLPEAFSAQRWSRSRGPAFRARSGDLRDQTAV